METLDINKGQEEAISHVDGPVLVLSCPGSGKTTTLMYRLAHLKEAGYDTGRILTVTFSNEAAKAMKEKYMLLFGASPSACPPFKTIHSLCRGILLEEGLLPSSPPLQGGEQEQAVLPLIRDKKDRYEKARDFLTNYGAVRSNRQPLDRARPEKMDVEDFLKIAEGYEQWKADAGRIDFDDMLIMACDLLKQDDAVRRRWQARYDFIQCDEYQDVNLVQKELLYMLAGDGRNLCAVGDDDQSIYKFRGADPKIMFDFEKELAPVKVVYLSYNYRSGQDIVSAAGRFIKGNTDRFKKEFISFRGRKGQRGQVVIKKLSSRGDQMDFLVKQIEERSLRGVPYEDMAILVRTNRQAGGIGELLDRHGIPFSSPDPIRSIYDEWIFDDIQAYLNLALGGNDNRDLLRILNRPARYLKTANYKDVPFELGPLLAGVTTRGVSPELARRNRKRVMDFYNTFAPGSLSLQDPPSMLFDKLTRTGYPSCLAGDEPYKVESRAIYKDLKNDARTCATIEEWLAHARDQKALVRKKNSEKEKAGVSIMTMHRSKGLEWDSVFLPDIIEGIMPSPISDDIPEERRLMYVAMTRAKDFLCITSYGKASEFFQSLAGTKRR